MAAKKQKRSKKRAPARPAPPPPSPSPREIPNASRARAREGPTPLRTGFEPSPLPPAKLGRPTKYTPELEALLLEWIANGGTLRGFCRLPHTLPGDRRNVELRELGDRICEWIAVNGRPPSHVTVHEWLDANPKLKDRYLRARRIGGLHLGEEIVDVVTTPQLGEIVTEESVVIEGPGGKEVPGKKRTVRREDMLGHRRLQAEYLIKLLAKWLPDDYGNKVDVDHKSGGKSFDTLLREVLGDDKEERPPQ